MRYIDVNLFFKGIPIRRNLEGLNHEIVVAMDRHQIVKLNDQERQPWSMLLCGGISIDMRIP